MKPQFKRAAMALPMPLVAAGSISCTAQEQAKPNIVYLMFDDLGYGDLGCYGQEVIETPNIDALAARGVLFTDMYTACPLSAPSRCSIMTGRHSGHSQIRFNINPKEPYASKEALAEVNDKIYYLGPDYEGQYNLADTTYTLARMMQDAGYVTGMVGKWGLGTPDGSTPNKMGFDYFYGFICQGLAHQYYPYYLWENGEQVLTGNKLQIPGYKLPAELDPYDVASYFQYSDKYYSPDLMFDKLQKFVSDNAKKPFFLMWTTTTPHSAVQAPLDEVMHYVDKIGDEEPVTDPGDYFPNRYPHATYAAMITHIDTQVGLLVDQLKELGIYDNTIIIVTSDNGPACNGNSPMEYFHSGGPFRCRQGWGKSSLHEGGVRMPFVVAWGDRLEPTKTSHVAQFPDIMPTFAELAGVEAPENDGISFLPTLTGGEQAEHEYLYWEFPGKGGWIGVRWGKWKGICRKVSKGNNAFELFDLEADPQELNNVAADHPDVIEKFWQFVRESHNPTPNGEPQFNISITWPEE